MYILTNNKESNDDHKITKEKEDRKKPHTFEKKNKCKNFHQYSALQQFLICGNVTNAGVQHKHLHIE